MGVFSSFSKTVLSDLVNVQEFSIFDLLKKFSRIKKLFLFKRSSFEKKVSSSKVEVVPLGEIDAKKLEDLDKFIFFESQDLHSIDVKATFNYIFKSYKNNMNQYYSLCSYFLAALSLNHVVLKKTAVLDIKKQSNRRVITVVLDGEPSTIDMVVFLLRLNFSVALEHDDKVLKLEALKSLKKKINISFKGNHPDKIWSNQVYWPERTVRFLSKAVSIHRGLYELVFDASKTRFAYHCTMYGDFLEVSDPSSIFTGHHAVYHNRFFSKHNISIVNFLKKAVLDFLFCYSLEFKVFFPKIVEALKNQKIIAFDTIDKCQNILADTNLINLGSKNKKFNNWNEFQRVNKSIAQLNYIENRDHFIQSLVFYLFGLMKELTRDYELSTYDMYIYLRAATLTDNSFLERFFVESLDDSQSAKLDFSFNQSKKMIKEVYDRL